MRRQFLNHRVLIASFVVLTSTVFAHGDVCDDPFYERVWVGPAGGNFSVPTNWYPEDDYPDLGDVAVFENPDDLCIFNLDPEPEVAWDVGALRIESSAAPGQNQEPSILRMLGAESPEYEGKVNFLCGVSSDAGINAFTIHLGDGDMVSLGNAIQGLDPILDVDIADVQVKLAGSNSGGKFSMTGTFGPGHLYARNGIVGVGYATNEYDLTLHKIDDGPLVRESLLARLLTGIPS